MNYDAEWSHFAGSVKRWLNVFQTFQKSFDENIWLQVDDRLTSNFTVKPAEIQLKFIKKETQQQAWSTMWSSQRYIWLLGLMSSHKQTLDFELKCIIKFPAWGYLDKNVYDFVLLLFAHIISPIFFALFINV
jgi:hypothetical protein